jgi:hypothetical protein
VGDNVTSLDGQAFGDLEALLDRRQQQIPASEVSRPPSNPTCTGSPATTGNPGKTHVVSSMRARISVASVLIRL